MSDAFIICLLIGLIVAAIAVRHIQLLKKGIRIRDRLINNLNAQVKNREELIAIKDETISILKEATEAQARAIEIYKSTK